MKLEVNTTELRVLEGLVLLVAFGLSQLSKYFENELFLLAGFLILCLTLVVYVFLKIHKDNVIKNAQNESKT